MSEARYWMDQLQRELAAAAQQQLAEAALTLACDELPAAERDQAEADFVAAAAQLPGASSQGDAEARRERMRALGRRGGLATLRAKGYGHMREIARRGFKATVEKHYNGDKARYLAVLHARGLAAIDPFPANTAWRNYDLPPPPRGTAAAG